MHESSADFYGEKGRVEEVHRLLLRIGRKRFGPPSLEIETRLRAMQNLDRLERLSENVLDAQSWQELISTP